MAKKYERNEDGSLKLDAQGDPVEMQEAPQVDPPVTPPPAPPAGSGFDLEKLDPEAKKYILDLRKENAGYRTKAKEANEALKGVKGALGLNDDQVSPEERAAALAAQVEHQQLQQAILTNALEHGVPKEGIDYFTFLINKAVEALGEGEELPDTKIAALALEAKGKAIKPKANSSVQPPAGGGAPPPGEQGETTVEEFVAMNITEKSKLYTEHPETYERLWKLAMNKKLIK